MKEYIYKVYIRGILQDWKFNCASIQCINKHVKCFIRLYGNRLNIVIRNYYTNDIIQDCSIHNGISVLNRFDSNLKLIKRKNSFYFANHENKRKI